MTWVDAAIFVNGQIRVVLEIEENNVRSLCLCTKVFAAALCNVPAIDVKERLWPYQELLSRSLPQSG